MLGKLLKYDLIKTYKFLSIFYCLAIFFAILTRLLSLIENSFIMGIITSISNIATIAMIVSILINNIMRLWVNFKSTLYGDESYLTHTLPVSRKTIYSSKLLLAILTIFTSMIVILITLLIAYYSKENMEILKGILLSITNNLDISFLAALNLIFLIIFVLFVEVINIVQTGFTGIILGHKQQNNKIAYSSFIGFLVYMTTQVLALICLFIVSFFLPELKTAFSMINMSGQEYTSALKTVAYLAIIVYTVVIFILYLLNQKFLKKGVDIE